MKRIKEQSVRGVVLVGKAALFCMGILAVLAAAVVVAVLVPVMLLATVQPATVIGGRSVHRVARFAEEASEATRRVTTVAHKERTQEAS